MKFRMSLNVAVPTDRADEARLFYKDVLGFPIRHMEPATTEFNASPLSLFVDRDEELRGPVLELLVDDVEAARELLTEHGCTVVRWEGAGGDCFIRDPFGVTFNLWQDLEV